MRFPLFIAGRYVKSEKGTKFLSLISIITIAGIAIGVTVLIMAISILEGFEDSISNNIIKFNAHINISGYGARNLKDRSLIEADLKNNLDVNISEFSTYISKKVILSKKDLAEGIILNGIDSNYAKMSLDQIIVSGNNRLHKNGYGIIIGKKLAEKFNVKIGELITVFSLNHDNPPSISNLPLVEQFELTGIYESGMAEYDDIHAYINFSTAEDFFELDDEVTGYNINLKEPSEIDSIKTVLSDMLSYPFYVRTYRDINRHIFTWLELQQKPVPIVLGLIIIVAVFNIVGAVLMLIVQKTSAIGVLRSMGVNSRQILQIFLLQGLVLGTAGIAIGNFLALTLSYLQNEYKIIRLPEEIYYLSSVPIQINLEIYILISVLGLILSLIVSFIPSFIASRIQPLTAIKFN